MSRNTDVNEIIGFFAKITSGKVNIGIILRISMAKAYSSNYRECISRVCEAASLKTSTKKRRVDKQVMQCICDTPEMYNAGSNATLTVSSKFLSLVTLETNEEIAKHDMPRISFASGGDTVRLL